MTGQDIPLLHGWLNRPHIVEWWGGDDRRATLDETRARYLPSVLAAERVTPYISMLGDEPVGYAQSYVALGSGDRWWEEETDPGVRGIDQSLADPAQLGQGLGTQLVTALVELLFRDPEVTLVQADPAPTNLRHPLLREGRIPKHPDDRHPGRTGGVHGSLEAGMIRGSCLCGQVRFALDGRPQFIDHCHCSCERWLEVTADNDRRRGPRAAPG